MTNRTRTGVVAVLAVGAVVVPLALALARVPRWWAWIASEDTPMTWFQSVALVLAAAGAGLTWYVAGLAGHDRRSRHGFVVLAAGFGALALDERFALHERIRDGYLAPRAVRVPFLPWVGPGDFLLLMVAVVGLALLPLVMLGFRDDRWGRALLVAGVALSAIAVGADSIDPASFSVGVERLEQTLEECVEYAAGLAFVGAVTLRLLDLLDLLGRPADLQPERPIGGSGCRAT